MLQSIKRSLFEAIRSARHNLLHLKRFQIGYANGRWVARHDHGELQLSTYPYLACHDMEGYLKNGEWSIEPGMTVIDAGGCNGEFALYASQCVGPTGRVLMLEPDSINAAVAQKNIELNGSPANLTVVPVGLWNANTTLRFAAGREGQSGIVMDDTDQPGDFIEIPVMKLADLVREHRLDRIDFIKMDIEGAELEAMSVASELPTQFCPRYAIASYHPRDGKPTAQKLEALFASMNYNVETSNPRHLTTWAWPKTEGVFNDS